MDLYVDVFKVEKSETMTSGAKPLNPVLFGFTSGNIPFDKLKENNQLEMEKYLENFIKLKYMNEIKLCTKNLVKTRFFFDRKHLI